MRRAAFYLVLALAAAAFLYPFLWMAATSLKPPGEVGGLSLIPDQPTLENYRLMWARAPFGRALFNSLLVATSITFSVRVPVLSLNKMLIWPSSSLRSEVLTKAGSLVTADIRLLSQMMNMELRTLDTSSVTYRLAGMM